MCGHDWCSVRISKEIQEFASGKDAAAQPARVTQLSPLAQKAREAATRHEKLSCHSDVADDEAARKAQDRLVRGPAGG
jgi:phosphomethylpyrimidine synthase